MATAVKPEFRWGDGTIALLANWGPICYLLAVFPSSWLLDIKGLRVSIIGSASLLLAGSGIRAVTLQYPAATYLIHAGQVRAPQPGRRFDQ